MRAFIIALFLLAGNTGAWAQSRPEFDDVFSWSGIYAGITAGYAAGSSDFFIPDTGIGEARASFNLQGLIGGIHAGGNHQLANGFVFGAEADLLSYPIDGGTIFALITGGAGLGAELDGNVTWSSSARVRAGYALDRTLPYVTAGVAAAEYEATLHPIGGTETVSHDETHVGWTLGAGIEQALSDNVLIRIEYRYSDFGSEPFVPSSDVESSFSVRAHDLRAGLSYKF